MYDDQMEMFQDGGLKDQGNTIDPVSGNDVPSGSLKEEVRDDIDAKLSPGEFVFPADVVRFVGLEKLMMMRDKAKKGLSRMEDMGQMGNSDEATIDDDVPFGMEDLIIVSGGPENEMSKGGVPSYGRGGMLLGFDSYVPPTTYYNPATGQEMTSTKIGGDFFPPLPDGFVEKPKRAETKPRDVKIETTKVKSELGSGEVDGGPDKGDKSFGEMSPNEQVSYGDDLRGPFGGVIGAIEKGVGYGIEGFFGPGIAGNIAALAVETVTGQPVNTSLGIVDQIERNQNTAIDLSLSDKGMISPSVAKAARDQYEAAQKAKKASYDVSQQLGVAQDLVEQHQDDVSRGNAPPGSVANSFGGHSTTKGPQQHSTNNNNEVVSNKKHKEEMARHKAAKEKAGKAGKEAKEAKEKAEATIGAQERGIAGTPDPDPDPASGSYGGANTPGGGPTSASEAGNETESGDTVGEGSVGGGAEIATGGFIPKRLKKKQKKMKRGGLASRK